MKTSYLCFVLVGAMLLCGCAITHDYKPAAGIKNASVINIIDNSGTRKGFLDAMKSWLDENGHKYNILSSNNSKDREGWVLTYDGKWSWDITIYLSKAVIEAYKDGVQSGFAKYSVQGNSMSANPSKWRNAEKTIREMMSNLFK